MPHLNRESLDLQSKWLGNMSTESYDTSFDHRHTIANYGFQIPANNSWYSVCKLNDSMGVFIIAGGDSPSVDRAMYSYGISSPAYGVLNIVREFYHDGGWNTGTFDCRITTLNGNDSVLQVKYSSYYSSSNTGTFRINFIANG